MDKRIWKLTVHKALHPRYDIDYMCQESGEEDNTITLWIVWIHQKEDSKTILKRGKGRLIIPANDRTDNREQQQN